MFLSTQNMLKLKDIFKENINIFTHIFLLLSRTYPDQGGSLELK